MEQGLTSNILGTVIKKINERSFQEKLNNHILFDIRKEEKWHIKSIPKIKSHHCHPDAKEFMEGLKITTKIWRKNK